MNGDQISKIEQIINEGYDFKLGDYISTGFEIFKKNVGGFILFTLLFMVIMGVIQSIPYYVGIVATTFFIGPALTVGFFLVAHKVHKGETAEFGDFFKGFDHIGQLAITALVQTLIIYASLIPFAWLAWDSGLFEWYMEALTDPMAVQGSFPPMPPSWSLLLLLPAVFLGVSYSWSYMFVVFQKMPFWDAMESSRKLIGKNWLMVFLFLFIMVIIAMAGVIAFCIGILASVPAVYCMMYAAFADVTQLNTDIDTGGDIEQHLVG